MELFDGDFFTEEYYKWRLDNAPSNEAEPVRHGEWVDITLKSSRRTVSFCTSCGNPNDVRGDKKKRHKPYCPNCGAKMDGGEKE